MLISSGDNDLGLLFRARINNGNYNIFIIKYIMNSNGIYGRYVFWGRTFEYIN